MNGCRSCSLGVALLAAGVLDVGLLFDAAGATDCEMYAETMRVVTLESGFPSITDCRADGLTCVARGGSLLMILDVSDPTAPILTGQLDLATSITDMAVADGVVFTVQTNGDVVAVDVDPPIAMHVLDVLSLGSGLQDVALRGDQLIVLTASGTVQVVGAADPAELVARGSVVTLETANDVAMIGHHALVTSDDGLAVVDVADPDTPVHVATWTTGIPGNSWPTASPEFGEISVDGTKAAVTGSQWGIYDDGWSEWPVLEPHVVVIDLTDPMAPAYLSWRSMFSDHVLLRDEKVYLSEG